jgi:phosphoglucomutase
MSELSIEDTRIGDLVNESNKTKIVFGTSGWRGTLGQDFEIENVQRAAQGVAKYYTRYLHRGCILIGFDSRRGNVKFAKEVAAILTAYDIPIRILIEEPTPTPVLAYLAHKDNTIVGVVNLTASHNRYTDGGFKFSPYHGGAADRETTDRISAYANDVRSDKWIPYALGKEQGLIHEISLQAAIHSYVDGYLIPILNRLGAWETIKDYVKDSPDFTLILDPMQGTTVKYLEAVYRCLEHDVGRSFIELIHTNNRDPEFREVHGAPNPTEHDSITELIRRVSMDNHTLGFATDGDGDRFGVLDFGGSVISANAILMMLAYFLAKKGLDGAVGKTVVTSNAVNAVARYLGLELVETPVGFKWFVERTIRDGTHFLVAGEESAHIGVGPFMASWDDGIAISLLCLWMIADTKITLKALKEKIEHVIGRKFLYLRENIALTPDLKGRAVSLINQAAHERAQKTALRDLSIVQMVNALEITPLIDEVTTVDGVKVIFDTGEWFGIRLSGTENVARIYIEAANVETQNVLRMVSGGLLHVSPDHELMELLYAAGTRNPEVLPDTNRFRTLGFEDAQSRLGWVHPPAWHVIEECLEDFMQLKAVQKKTRIIFVGMGGSINAIKALLRLGVDGDSPILITLDSLDPAALSVVLGSDDDLSSTLVIGISKSGTTTETHALLSTLREAFHTQQLADRNHFLWLTDIPDGQRRIEALGWRDVDILPIQVDSRTDIGGRFTAPHTLLFLIPLLFLCNKEIHRLREIWNEYCHLRAHGLPGAMNKAYTAVALNTRTFAIVLEEPLASALETWGIQLFQESLGSKLRGFNPKTVVAEAKAVPNGFYALRYVRFASNILVDTMLIMYHLQVFVALLACEKCISFVTQPEVERYKRKMKELSLHPPPRDDRVKIPELLARQRNWLQAHAPVDYVEVVCYWYPNDIERTQLQQTFHAYFPDKTIQIFTGSDWNHHSYQAASWNDDTFFLLLTRHVYSHNVPCIAPSTLQDNIDILRTIAHATYQTLKDKAQYYEV